MEPLQINEIIARVANATQNPGHPLPAKIHIFLQGLAAARRAAVLSAEESSAPAAMLEAEKAGKGAGREGDARERELAA